MGGGAEERGGMGREKKGRAEGWGRWVRGNSGVEGGRGRKVEGAVWKSSDGGERAGVGGFRQRTMNCCLKRHYKERTKIGQRRRGQGPSCWGAGSFVAWGGQSAGGRKPD